MTALPDSLEGLRHEIDKIDDQIHDLLVQRTAVVGNIAQVKKSGPGATYRPAREAEVVRRLLTRHRGPFSRRALVRLWRELLSATIRLQGEFGIAVYRTDEATEFWDLARDHYGRDTPITALTSEAQVIATIAEGAAAVGVLPMPQDDTEKAWWPILTNSNPSMPQVIARLPFLMSSTVREDAGEALVIGCTESEPTGDDRTLYALELAPQMSRTRLRDAFTEAGFDLGLLLAQVENESEPMRLYLADVDGFLDGEDQRLDNLQHACGHAIARIMRVGGYAQPISSGPIED